MSSRFQLPFLKKIVGYELIQVSIGRNEIVLSFFPETLKIIIFSLSSFYRYNEGVLLPLKQRSGFLRIISHKISRISTENNGHELVIRFSNNESITLSKEDDLIESVVFDLEKSIIIV